MDSAPAASAVPTIRAPLLLPHQRLGSDLSVTHPPVSLCLLCFQKNWVEISSLVFIRHFTPLLQGSASAQPRARCARRAAAPREACGSPRLPRVSRCSDGETVIVPQHGCAPSAYFHHLIYNLRGALTVLLGMCSMPRGHARGTASAGTHPAGGGEGVGCLLWRG